MEASGASAGTQRTPSTLRLDGTDPLVAAHFNLGTLLLDFFKLYGRSLNYRNVGVSVRGSGMFFNKRTR